MFESLFKGAAQVAAKVVPNTPKGYFPPPEFFPSTTINHSIHKAATILSVFTRREFYETFSEWSVDAIDDWYANETDPMVSAIIGSVGLSIAVWLTGEITGNVSQVDRLWTFLPVLYSFHFTFWPLVSPSANAATLFTPEQTWVEKFQVYDQRMLLLFALQVLWSLRLTTNTFRRGFFSPSSEDYRWEVVRAKTPWWQFKIMNLTFISFIQIFLLLSTSLPQYLLLTLHQSPTSTSPPLNTIDYLLAGLFVSILTVEMIADNQQQNYQWFKREEVKEGEVVSEKDRKRKERGFVAEGLWSWSRHPNFALEQSTFWVLYLFTVLPFLPSSRTFTFTSLPKLLSTLFLHPSTFLTHLPTPSAFSSYSSLFTPKGLYAAMKAKEGLYWNYTIWAPFAMSCLFYASTDLTEKITAGKYPLYAEYQKRVGMLWPPITICKTLWLTATGEKEAIDAKIWGNGVKVGGVGGVGGVGKIAYVGEEKKTQ